MDELTGHGTLYDTDENEIASVAYRIERTPAEGSPVPTWGGELTFEDEDAVLALDPGTYLLETEDGTRGEVEVEPAGAAEGDARHVAFRGHGVFGMVEQ